MKKPTAFLTFLSAFSLFAVSAQAEDYVITIKNNQFSPQTLTIPADQKVKVTVKNQDATPAEFESYDLKREKVISGNSEAIVFIGPITAGSYAYFDDFHRDITKGVIIAK